MSTALSFVGELKKELAMVYGEAGSGKTTLALQAALACVEHEQKVLFLDTEGGFSLERFQQLAGKEWAQFLDKIVIITVKDFTEQYTKIQSFIPLAQKFGLIIIDTIGHFYRQELKNDAQATNRVMDRQLRFLFEMSKHVPVLLTNQVYGNIESDGVTSVGGKMILKWCQKIIELRKKPRVMIMHKSEERTQSFSIVDGGLVLC